MPTTIAAPRTVHSSEADIARRAYELYCERNRRDGHDLDDWLQAERELRVEPATRLAQSA